MTTVEFQGHKLSKLSFGTVQFGLDYGISNIQGKPTQKSANEIIKYLRKNGINCFDTAIAYGNSEEVLGNALHQNDAYIISKIKSDIFREDLVSTLQNSLKNLKVDKLFGLLLHDSELLFDWEEEYTQQIQLLENQNLIDYFGVSIYTSDEFELAIKNPMIRFIQIPFNIFDQRAVNNNWFQKAQKANKLIFIRSIFLQGLFFMDLDKLTGNLKDACVYLEQMHLIRKKLDLSVSEFAMSYVNSLAKNSLILFGCDSLQQAQDNIQSYTKLPILDEAILNRINQQFTNVPEYILNPGEWSL